MKNTIDWANPQWVQHKTKHSLIVLTTGKYNKFSFEGTLMPCGEFPLGEFRDDWGRDSFKPIQGIIDYKIQNL